MGTFTSPDNLYKPSVDEDGWADEVNTNFDTIQAKITELAAGGGGDSSTGFVNVKDHGAVGNGTTNDGAAINAAIQACPEGGTVFFPVGHYFVGTTILVVNRSITMAGSGFWNWSQDFLGQVTWGGSNYGTWWGGTVIRSSVVAGQGIRAVKPDKPIIFNMRDLMIVGPNVAGSTGVSVGGTPATNNGANCQFQNTLVVAFEAGYNFGFVENSAFYHLQVRGCNYGIYMPINSATNANGFYFTEIQTSTVAAVTINDGNWGDHFYGGIVQACMGLGFNLSGASHTIDGFHFENVGMTYAIRLNSLASLNAVSNLYLATADDDILIECQNSEWRNIRNGGAGSQMTIAGGANYTKLDNVSNMTISDSSGTTFYQRTGSNAAFAVRDYFDMRETGSPAGPSADTARIYAKDNGAGKTILVAKFATGAEQIIATEP